MSAFYGSFSRAETEEESLRTIEEGLELGINMIDTAWNYQSWGADGAPSTTNEELVGEARHRNRGIFSPGQRISCRHV